MRNACGREASSPQKTSINSIVDSDIENAEDSEDEDNEVEEFTIPLKSRKRKISSSGKKAKKPRLQIPKKSARKRRAQ